MPSAAIQRSTRGEFVYVVKADRTAAMRPVSVGVSQGDEVSISTGLTPGDLVVVDGADKLREGAKVEVQARGDASPAKGSS